MNCYTGLRATLSLVWQRVTNLLPAQWCFIQYAKQDVGWSIFGCLRLLFRMMSPCLWSVPGQVSHLVPGPLSIPLDLFTQSAQICAWPERLHCSNQPVTSCFHACTDLHRFWRRRDKLSTFRHFFSPRLECCTLTDTNSSDIDISQKPANTFIHTPWLDRILPSLV